MLLRHGLEGAFRLLVFLKRSVAGSQLEHGCRGEIGTRECLQESLIDSQGLLELTVSETSIANLVEAGHLLLGIREQIKGLLKSGGSLGVAPGPHQGPAMPLSGPRVTTRIGEGFQELLVNRNGVFMPVPFKQRVPKLKLQFCSVNRIRVSCHVAPDQGDSLLDPLGTQQDLAERMRKASFRTLPLGFRKRASQ